MSRMRSLSRALAYKFCVERDGERCVDCGRVPATIIRDPEKEAKRLIVDHVDRNPENNAPTNWQLRCDRCNIKKDPRGRQAHPKFSSHLRLNTERAGLPESKFFQINHKMISRRKEDIESESPRVRYVETAKGLQAEPIFREFVEKTVRQFGSVQKQDLLDAAAEDFTQRTGNSISQQCLSKYLSKLCNPINGAYDLKEIAGEWYVVKRVPKVGQGELQP